MLENHQKSKTKRTTPQKALYFMKAKKCIYLKKKKYTSNTRQTNLTKPPLLILTNQKQTQPSQPHSSPSSPCPEILGHTEMVFCEKKRSRSGFPKETQTGLPSKVVGQLCKPQAIWQAIWTHVFWTMQVWHLFNLFKGRPFLEPLMGVWDGASSSFPVVLARRKAQASYHRSCTHVKNNLILEYTYISIYHISISILCNDLEPVWPLFC